MLRVTVRIRVPINGILPILHILNRQNLLPELYRTEFSVQKIPTCEQLLPWHILAPSASLATTCIFAQVHIIGTLVHFCVIGNSLEFPIIQKKHPQKDAFCSLTTREIDVREKIRTPDTLVRSQVLYPAELRTHIQFIVSETRYNAGDRNRTGTVFLQQDFKSCASASSATPA